MEHSFPELRYRWFGVIKSITPNGVRGSGTVPQGQHFINRRLQSVDSTQSADRHSQWEHRACGQYRAGGQHGLRIGTESADSTVSGSTQSAEVHVSLLA